MKSFGLHRVSGTQVLLPQSAAKLDNRLPIDETELLIEVDYLNIDSNSFRQIREACTGDKESMKSMILRIIRDRGKMHNPVTGSGGMLIGSVKEKADKCTLNTKPGDYIASLISLTLTPLYIDEIIFLNADNPQIRVRGYAILFNSSPFAKLPEGIAKEIALSALDVCGAPKLAQIYSQDAGKILIMGGGKSGVLSAFAALDSGASITIFEKSPKRVRLLKSFDLPFKIEEIDVKNLILLETYFQSFDLCLDCMNIPDTEMSSILCTKPNGTIIFFNTATSFTQAALGAEGIGTQVRMLIGNGFYPGHAELAFELIRKHPSLLNLLSEE